MFWGHSGSFGIEKYPMKFKLWNFTVLELEFETIPEMPDFTFNKPQPFSNIL